MGEFRQKWKTLNPLLRAWVYVASGIITLLIILEIIINVWGSVFLKSNLEKKIKQATGDTYSIQLGKVDLDLYKGTVIIHKLRIHADTAAFHPGFSASRKPASSVYEGTVQKLKVGGFHLFSALWGKKLSIHEILIQKPDITIINNPHPVPKDTSQHFSSVDSSIYADISNNYRKLKIGKFAIRRAHVVSIQSGDTLMMLGRVNLALKNIKVDSASAHSGRLFVTDQITLKAHHLMDNLSDSLNKVTLDKVLISSRNHTILLDSLHLKPRYPKFVYSEKKGVQIDRIDLQIPKLLCRHVNFSAFADSGSFHSGYVEIGHAKFQDFHSMLPPKPPKTVKKLYNAALLQLKQKVKLDSVRINNSYVSYAEYHHPTPKAGKVTFERLNAGFSNVTNFPAAIKKRDTMRVSAQARVMGKGLLKVHWTFPLDTHNAFQKIRGSLGSMPLTAFNPALKYIAFIKIDHGKLNHLNFKFTANDDQSSGFLLMNYQNLKVSVLNKKTAKKQGLIKNVLSFAANKFIIKKNNTPKNGMRTGKISFKHNKYKSTWNFWWKSLLSGIKTSIK
jgi:hypothetical protein